MTKDSSLSPQGAERMFHTIMGLMKKLFGDYSSRELKSIYPIVDKMVAFGFEVAAVDGHNFDELEAAFQKARETKGKPFAIVMKTVKGKDVSFMENNAGWHGKAPNDAEYAQAMAELKAKLAELEA